MLSAECAKEASKHELMSVSEVVEKAQNRDGGSEDPGDGCFVKHPDFVAERLTRRAALGCLFRCAASLLEAMEFHTEERLTYKYLHEQPPLHPRRTLDQSYYGALKSTRARDRDQVVYRGTTPGHHDCIDATTCRQCRDDIRKVPRLVMVDQLWLWILDERAYRSPPTILSHPIVSPTLRMLTTVASGTVISSFPRRWGKNRPDPSAIHKSLRMRLKYARGGEIASAYDLALTIIDECSRTFFDRTKLKDRQPNLVGLFADAVRGVVSS